MDYGLFLIIAFNKRNDRDNVARKPWRGVAARLNTTFAGISARAETLPRRWGGGVALGPGVAELA